MQSGNLDDVCATVGYTATRILSAWYAGRSLYVPSNARDDHPLASLIGMPALRALVREFASIQIPVPPQTEDDRFRRDRRIAEALVAGHTPREVAAAERLTVRRVEQIRADLVTLGWLRYAAGAGRRQAPLVDATLG
jgi:hypothetical protein